MVNTAIDFRPGYDILILLGSRNKTQKDREVTGLGGQVH
jgi:hypothetical protein